MNIFQIPIDPQRINVAANDNATHPVAGAERLPAGARAALVDYSRCRPRGRREKWRGYQFVAR